MPSTATSCAASWRENLLTLENALFREIWRAEADGTLRLFSFRRCDGPEWVAPKTPAALRPGGAPLSTWPDAPADSETWTAEFTTRLVERPGVSTSLTVVELRFSTASGRSRLHRFQLYPGVAGAVHQTFGAEIDACLDALANQTANPLTGRMHTKDNGQMFATLPTIAHPPFGLAMRHLIARDVAFADQTDHHSNLVFTREFLLHPGERCLPLTTNLVCVEAPASAEGEGFLWLLQAPLHHVRAEWSPYFDFLFAFHVGELVATVCPAGYAVARIAYTGGATGATLALHALQRAFYDAAAPQPGRLLSNTWGDRAGAAHLSEAFVFEEIAAARRLGVEIVQIDDGWQKGATVNTVAAGGVWNGFWAADPEFWTPHAQRFPRGLAPLVAAADEAGVRLGLWYAPDSTHDLTNWERDAAQILQLWREHRIAYFKLDAVKLHSRLAETRFHALCDRVLGESCGAIFFDFDATAENRPTYWGRPGGGALFLENRFTEEAGYHPHQTLRAVWTLAHYVRPERIRAEFLNPTRNETDYGDDPLRPSAYSPEYLFAVTWPTSPLAWFEVCRVPREISDRWAPLIALWKRHRQNFHAGRVVPIGEAPNGFAWTGFVSVRPDMNARAETSSTEEPVAYALIFRELTATRTRRIPLPALLKIAATGEGAVLAGEGRVRVADGAVDVEIPTARGFVLAAWHLPR